MENGRGSICIVDDERDVLEGLVPLLSNQYEVKCFTSAADALKAFDSGLDPDIVLSDLRMPQMSGFEMIEKLKERGVRAKVIVASGHADKASAIEALNLGVNGFLEKPFTAKQLRNTLVRVAPEPAQHNSMELVDQLIRLKDLYYDRAATAENFIIRHNLKFPDTDENRRKYLEEVRAQNELERQVAARRSGTK